MIGLIKRVVEDRGFGFLKTDSGEEYFFHISGLKNCDFRDLRVGQRVSFEVDQSPKGPRAKDVSPA